MKESQFGFRYDWKDMRPICFLRNTVAVLQIVGAIAGYLFLRGHDTFMNIWTGGAFATFPGFLIGYMIQKRASPVGLSENTVMVRRLGLIALFLTVAAIAFPQK